MDGRKGRARKLCRVGDPCAISRMRVFASRGRTGLRRPYARRIQLFHADFVVSASRKLLAQGLLNSPESAYGDLE